MRVNSVLVLWHDGWVEVDNPAGESAAGYRAEAFLSLGSQHDLDEVERQATELLAVHAAPREQIDAEFDPANATQRPYVQFRPGDSITVDGTPTRVHAMRVALSDNGPEYRPQLGVRIPTAEDRAATTAKKMSGGTLGGDAKIATPFTGRSSGGPLDVYAVDSWIYTSGMFDLSEPVTGSLFAREFDTTQPLTWHVTVNAQQSESIADPDATKYLLIEGYADGNKPPNPGGPGCSWSGFPTQRWPAVPIQTSLSPGLAANASYTFVVSTLPGLVTLGAYVQGWGLDPDGVVWISYVAVPSTGDSSEAWSCGT